MEDPPLGPRSSPLCDHFILTGTEGTGTGESFTRFPVSEGDCLIGGRGHSTANGIAHVADAGGYVPVRVNTGSLPLKASDGGRLNLLREVRNLHRPGAVSAWPAATDPGSASNAVAGRVCAIRRSDAAIAIAERKLRETAVSKGRSPKPETLEFARYAIVFTTFPASEFPPDRVLQWYRIRCGPSRSSSASGPSPSLAICPNTVLKARRRGYTENCSPRR